MNRLQERHLNALQEENEQLRSRIRKLEEWATRELDQSFRDHLNGYTHGECGYEEAQEEVQDLLTDPTLSESLPQETVWVVVMRGKRSLVKTTEQFYLTEEDAEAALASHPDAQYRETRPVHVSWLEV